ncbi:hypothetical protein ACLD9W_01935 [Neisseria sp. WLZKY-1]|uniref:hypothetical protein n=1 Tax=Neisseria sp. WLZKY-1 TaxID=3390377 RepID=UPI00397E83B5
MHTALPIRLRPSEKPFRRPQPHVRPLSDIHCCITGIRLQPCFQTASDTGIPPCYTPSTHTKKPTYLSIDWTSENYDLLDSEGWLDTQSVQPKFNLKAGKTPAALNRATTSFSIGAI